MAISPARLGGLGLQPMPLRQLRARLLHRLTHRHGLRLHLIEGEQRASDGEMVKASEGKRRQAKASEGENGEGKRRASEGRSKGKRRATTGREIAPGARAASARRRRRRRTRAGRRGRCARRRPPGAPPPSGPVPHPWPRARECAAWRWSSPPPVPAGSRTLVLAVEASEEQAGVRG